MISYKGLHHPLCAGVQPEQSLTLGDSLANQLRIDAFKISKNDQVLEACFIPNISFGIQVCLAPFLCRDAEQCNIQHICFIGVGKALTLWGHIRRDQYIFDCIRMVPPYSEIWLAANLGNGWWAAAAGSRTERKKSHSDTAAGIRVFEGNDDGRGGVSSKGRKKSGHPMPGHR